MAEGLGVFVGAAKGMSTSPLGIIALFIVLIYGIAALVIVLGASLSPTEKRPLIYCMTIFPFFVLAIFSWLVAFYPGNLYAPGDFKDEKNYLMARQQGLEAAAALGAAAAKDAKNSGGLLNLSAISAVASQAVIRNYNSVEKKMILWIDDNPDNNIYERQAFQKVGYQIFLAKNSNEALTIIDNEAISVIISDFKRDDDAESGYNLLDKIRKNGIKVPFFFYSSSANQKYIEEAMRRGAQGETNNANDLFKMVTALTS